MAEYIEVGMFASRNADGTFGESVPLFVEATPEMLAGEQRMINQLAGVFAETLANYININKKGGKDEISD